MDKRLHYLIGLFFISLIIFFVYVAVNIKSSKRDISFLSYYNIPLPAEYTVQKCNIEPFNPPEKGWFSEKRTYIEIINTDYYAVTSAFYRKKLVGFTEVHYDYDKVEYIKEDKNFANCKHVRITIDSNHYRKEKSQGSTIRFLIVELSK